MGQQKGDDPKKYDDSEAVRLLSEAGEESQPDERTAAVAATELLAALSALSDKSQIKVEGAADGSVALTAFNVRATVYHQGDGKLRIRVGPNVHQVHDLHLDPVTRRLEGPAYKPQNPWDVPRYRSALAVVVEQALAAIRAMKTAQIKW